MTSKLLEYLQLYMNKMHEHVPGIISVSAVEIATGRTLLSKSVGNQDLTELDRLQASTVKYALKGLDYIHNLDVKRFEDIIITLEEQIHILMTSDVQSVMSYIILDANNANLALAQRFHKQFYSESVQAIVNEFGEENVRKHPFFQPQDFTIEREVVVPNTTQAPKEEKKSGGFFSSLFSNS